MLPNALILELTAANQDRLATRTGNAFLHALQTAIVKHAEATDAAEAAVHALMVKHALTEIVFQYFVLPALVLQVPVIVLAVPKNNAYLIMLALQDLAAVKV